MKGRWTVLSMSLAMASGIPLPVSVEAGQTFSVSPAVQDESITVGFLIRSDMEDRLERATTAAGSSTSSRYGQYLTSSQVDAYRPPRARVNKVVRYLEQAGHAARVDRTGLVVEATMTVAQAEALAGVALVRHQTESGSNYWVPDHIPAVPDALQGAVEAILGLDQTPRYTPHPPRADGQSSATSRLASKALSASAGDLPFKSAQINSGTQGGCAESHGPFSMGPWVNQYPYTPNQWLHAYGIDQLHDQGHTGKGERLALIEIDGFDQADLDGFTTCFGLPSQSPVVHTVPEGDPLPGPGGETILDLQTMAATAPGLDRIDIYEARINSNYNLGKAMLDAISQPANVRPTVISISLGECEANQPLADSVLWERANRRAAALGISVFVSTGDQGPTACEYSAPWGRNAAALYSATYPSSSPWVTAVGGTNLVLDAGNQIVSEVPWNDWSWRGEDGDYVNMEIWAANSGASQWFKRPAWQNGFGPGPMGTLAHGRVTPDVALLADGTPGYAYLNGGTWQFNGGTSAATPLMAGGIAVLNEALRSQGKRRVGYLNPVLYSMGKKEAVRQHIFTDVTVGNNNTMWQTFGTPVTEDTTNPYFDAKPGYDGATGWGSPRFPALLEELKKRR